MTIPNTFYQHNNKLPQFDILFIPPSKTFTLAAYLYLSTLAKACLISHQYANFFLWEHTRHYWRSQNRALLTRLTQQSEWPVEFIQPFSAIIEKWFCETSFHEFIYKCCDALYAALFFLIGIVHSKLNSRTLARTQTHIRLNVSGKLVSFGQQGMVCVTMSLNDSRSDLQTMGVFWVCQGFDSL